MGCGQYVPRQAAEASARIARGLQRGDSAVQDVRRLERDGAQVFAARCSGEALRAVVAKGIEGELEASERRQAVGLKRFERLTFESAGGQREL